MKDVLEGRLDRSEKVLLLNVTNIDAFEELIKKAKQEADQLHKTINQLEKFELKIKFTSE